MRPGVRRSMPAPERWSMGPTEYPAAATIERSRVRRGGLFAESLLLQSNAIGAGHHHRFSSHSGNPCWSTGAHETGHWSIGA